jgi:hypothetical protein
MMAHVMREEMLRWRDQGRPEDRERMLTHLASCPSCAREYAEIIRTAPVVPVPQHFDAGDFVKRGYAVRATTASQARQGWLVSWKMWAGVLSAAAVLTLVVSTGLVPVPGSGGGGTTRGASIELVTPEPSATAPAVLEWRSGLVPERFRVELTDASGTVLYRVDTTETNLVLPEEIRRQLVPGGSYQYTVAALDADGEVITSASGTIAPGSDAR